jgi:ribonuclease D
MGDGGGESFEGATDEDGPEMPLPPESVSPAVIDSQAALAALAARMARSPRLGVDTEADSLHSYHEKVCLVQVGLPDGDELVDPLAGLDLTPLLDGLSKTEIVLHGADFDLRMLYRLGLDAPGKVFDTVIAARLTGAARFGYSALVAEHFGLTLPKGSQKANWARRPLAPELARYARNDTHFLLPLAALLERRLGELGRLEWLEQSCRHAVAAARVVRERDPQTEWRVRGSHALGPRASAVLRALWRWREDEARTIDRPPFHILLNEGLVDAARRLDRGETVTPRGLRGDRRQRFERAAKDALEVDRDRWPSRLPPVIRPRLTRAQEQRIAALRQRRDETAQGLAIDAELIAPRAALERIAVTGDDGWDMLLPWQQNLLIDRA